MDWEDHVQNAHIELLQAMSRFDPEFGIDFIAYAKQRVRGAVFNGMRSFLRDGRDDGHTELVHDRIESLCDGEGQDRLTDFVDVIAQLGIGFLVEMENSAVPNGNGATGGMFDGLLKDITMSLDERQRRIVMMHYIHKQPFVEISRELELSKGRISQLHKEALSRLREQLRLMNFDRDSFF
jgi:RNA polymerase sigma factor for flagellar operon FliA